MSGDQYRIKAAEFYERARSETDADIRAQFDSLVKAYLRLAEQADRNDKLDVTYEPPPPKIDEPEAR